MMFRLAFIFLLTFLPVVAAQAAARSCVVADSVTHIPLPGATVSDRSGRDIAISDSRGRLPLTGRESYPLTVRYLGFSDRTLTSPAAAVDTIFLSEAFSELPEVTVMSRKRPILHVLAYVREYSTLASESDTVTLFREKTVDYMFPTAPGTRFRGWSNPRVLASRSCYRFTDHNGLDSVSDKCQLHFSWSDWIGLNPEVALPTPLQDRTDTSYTLMGRYSPAEVWKREGDGVTIEIDALADTLSRKWVPDLRGFFHGNLDYQKFKISYAYDDIDGDRLAALNLTGYTFDIESDGRGREMFWFNRADEPFYVTTHAEVYILDREFVTVKEARKWEKREFDADMSTIYEPLEAPELSPETLALVERVGAIDREGVRLTTAPDRRLVGIHDGRRNYGLGHRALSLLKTVTGISSYKARKNRERRWNDFKKAQMERNRRSSR